MVRGPAAGAAGGGRRLTAAGAPCAAQEINKHLVTASLDLGGKNVRFDPCAHHTFASFPQKQGDTPGAAEPVPVAREDGADAEGAEATGGGSAPDAGRGAESGTDASEALPPEAELEEKLEEKKLEERLDKDAMLYFKAGMTLKECCLRSAAAPTFFPSYQGQVDGGLFANVLPPPPPPSHPPLQVRFGIAIGPMTVAYIGTHQFA